MAPKTKSARASSSSKSSFSKSSSSEKITVDPEKIIPSHQFILRLDFDEEKFKYHFDGLIWSLRTFVTLYGPKFKNKCFTTKDEDFFLIKFVLPKSEMKIIIRKTDVYVVGLTCNGEWMYPMGSDVIVKGGREAYFSLNYHPGYEFKVGFEVLKSSVSLLCKSDEKKWELAFCNIACNISEVIRFHSIHQVFHFGPSSVLSVYDCQLIKGWRNISKVWKIYCRFGVWNPTGLNINVNDPSVGEEVLAVVLDTTLESLPFLVVDAFVI